MSSRAKKKQANRVVREQLARERRRRRLVISIVAVLCVVAAGLAGLSVYEVRKPASYAVPAHATGDHTGIVVSPGRVEVDLYVDYLCPNCRNFEQSAASTLDQLVSDGRIRLVYRPIAILDQNTSPTGYSSRAGSAAACAADGGRFPAYTRALYAQQPAEGSAGLSNDRLVQIGTSVGLTSPSFAQCVRAQRYVSWMAHNTDAAAAANINGTPTVLVNGRQVDATADAISSAVNAA
ncbi:MAG TPA: thioredoxin domain-containing protein [Rugosimonospora sp.]|nr:thioredoxin domain-containing protein [Rugosimonospora sp.]